MSKTRIWIDNSVKQQIERLQAQERLKGKKKTQSDIISDLINDSEKYKIIKTQSILRS